MSTTSQSGEALEGFRLSPQQRRLWELSGNETGPFRCWLEMSIEGPLDAAVLRASFQDIVARHEILRTAFTYEPQAGELLQQIRPTGEARVEVFDVSDLDADAREARVRVLLDEAHRSPFDLQVACVHALLVKVAAEDHRLAIDMPAQCSDAVTMRLLFDELCRDYEARAQGRHIAGGSLQYADVAQWLLDVGEAGEEGLGRSFWAPRAAAGTTPQDETGAARPRFKPTRVSSNIPAEDRTKLLQLSACRQGTLEEALLACWCVLNWRVGEGDTVRLGALRDGRTSDELVTTPGLLARYLPLSVRLDPMMSFHEALDAVCLELSEIDEWQDFFDPSGGDRLAGDGLPAWLDVCFDYSAELESTISGEATFVSTRLESCIDRFRFRLSCMDQGEASGVGVVLHYDTDQVDADAAEAMVQRLVAVVRGAVARPSCPISELRVLGEEEWDRLVVAFNETRAPYPRDKCVHHCFEEQAQRTPGAAAVCYRGETASYREIDERANNLAADLVSRGFACGDIVGICLDRSIEMVTTVFAVLKAGGCYLPLDPQYPSDRLRFMIEDTEAAWLITNSAIAATLDSCGATVVNLDELSVRSEQHGGARVRSSVGPDNLAYVIYTSGSTGKPKGVMIDHRGLMISNQARMAYFGEPVGRFLLLSSFSFDSSAVGMFWPLLTGGSLYLVDPEIQQDVAKLSAYIAEHQITHLLTLPSFWGLILEELDAAQGASLETVIVAGEPCMKATVDAHEKKLPGCGVFSEYGATETTIFSSVYDCRGQTLLTAPLGEPIENLRMYILDTNLMPVPIGVMGEVYFGGESISPGYFNRPRLTAERFVPDHLSGDPGLRLYRSGDLARYLPDGQFEFLGRTDNQVKIRGFRVELEEIEAGLMTHPGVRQAAVTVDERAGTKRVVAYVVGAAQGAPEAGELREFLGATMPSYMIPSLFLPMAELPTTPTGKVDRAALPAPDAEPGRADREIADATTANEKILARIWREVLAVGEVGIHDNFFELGGDSILSIHIASRAKSAGLALTPLLVFEHQTIAELATNVGRTRETVAEQGIVTGDVPLTPIQHWFFERRVANRNHWNAPLLLEMEDEVSVEHLRAASGFLLGHHDALRTRWTRDGDAWKQTIVEQADEFPVDTHDLSGMAPAEQDAELEASATAYQRRLDMEHGPLMRFVVFDRGPSRPRLLFWVAHHLVVDIVSWRVLLEDLRFLLECLRRDTPPQLPEKTTSFQRWAAALHEYAGTDDLQSEADFWVDELSRGPAAIPIDREGGRGANTERSLRILTTIVPRAETEALVNHAPSVCGVRINDVLLAGFVDVLADWTGGDEVLVEVEGHGRIEQVGEGLDLSRTVGWFTSFHPLVFKRSGGSDRQDAVRAIRHEFGRVPGHGLGYGILRYLQDGAARAMRELPVAEVNFNYLGQFDRNVDESAVLRLAPRELRFGLDRDPEGLRSHLLEAVAWVVEERLEISWYYSDNVHLDETIEELASHYRNWLIELVNSLHGDQRPDSRSEFGWDESELDRISAAISKAKDVN